MTRLQWMKFGIVACFFAATSALAQSTAVRTDSDAPALISKAPASSNLLRALDSSLETVVSKVSRAVVQIVVTGYGPLEDHGHATASIVRQHAIGTGIIVDPDGYIITNAHVVEGAQRIRVILPSPVADSPLELQPIHAGQILEARLLGTHKQSDLALLKSMRCICLPWLCEATCKSARANWYSQSAAPKGSEIRSRWVWSAHSPGNSIQIIPWCISRLTQRSTPETVAVRW